MRITRLDSDAWDDTGRHYQSHALDAPAARQIEEAIRCLDGARHTIVTLEVCETYYMGIGGGGLTGMYLVYISQDDEGCDLLLAPGAAAWAADDVVRLTIAGEASEYPRRLCVNLATALHAARAFAASGTRDAAFAWERQR